MTFRLMATTAVVLLAVGGALAGGGVFPASPANFGFVLNVAQQVSAVIVLDPNGPVSTGAPATPTGAVGTIVLTRTQFGSASAVFRVEPDSSLGELRYGCNLALTSSRFVEFAPGEPGLPLGGPSIFSNWLPSEVTMQLFGQIGVTLFDTSTATVLAIPAITGVISQQCVPFPKAKDSLQPLLFSDIVQRFKLRPTPPPYPDLSANSSGTDPATQWRSGFLALQVGIGFWALPGTSTP